MLRLVLRQHGAIQADTLAHGLIHAATTVKIYECRRRRALWAARLSNKYLMDLLISEKALLGEDAPAMWLLTSRENMRQKDAALKGKHKDPSLPFLVPGSVFRTYFYLLRDKSKNKAKDEHSKRPQAVAF